VTHRSFRNFDVSVIFHAPLAFAYLWCTDYTPDDASIAGEDKMFALQRRIIKRTSRQVIFENLYNEGNGWAWERHTVTLKPPSRWHSEGIGNYQESHLDYSLTELPRNRTRFAMHWRSRPTPLYRGKRPSKRAVEDFVRTLWLRRRKALEHDYRSSIR
jgi:hypothetical protein